MGQHFSRLGSGLRGGDNQTTLSREGSLLDLSFHRTLHPSLLSHGQRKTSKAESSARARPIAACPALFILVISIRSEVGAFKSPVF